MATYMSSGLKKALLNTSVQAALSNCELRIYKGIVPANADAQEIAGNLLCKLVNPNTGSLTFIVDQSGGYLIKPTDEGSSGYEWSGINETENLATHFRITKKTDSGAFSNSDIRIQGTVGLFNTDLIMDPNFKAQTIQTVHFFAVGFPV